MCPGGKEAGKVASVQLQPLQTSIYILTAAKQRGKGTKGPFVLLPVLAWSVTSYL
jgi:hypothetical protein